MSEFKISLEREVLLRKRNELSVRLTAAETELGDILRQQGMNGVTRPRIEELRTITKVAMAQIAIVEEVLHETKAEEGTLEQGGKATAPPTGGATPVGRKRASASGS